MEHITSWHMFGKMSIFSKLSMLECDTPLDYTQNEYNFELKKTFKRQQNVVSVTVT